MIQLEYHSEVDEKAFHDVVAASFAMRRKTLRNNLSKWISDDMIREAGIQPEQRAETIPVENFIRLARLVSENNVSITIPGTVVD